VRRALEELIALLGPNDRVTLIGFARQPRLLAEAVAGNQAGHLVELSARTPAEGGTNLEEALKLAGQLALRHKLDTAQNRIVLLTDGAANLGNADPARLAQSVEALRQQRIAFDACGIGLEGVGDVVLEALTRKGDGRYYVVDRPETADASFARQLAGAFRPAAENVKLQVRFNPARVGNYRLVGFEQHRLREEDFRNDKVDAAELAADEGANAVYQVEVLPQGSGEIGEVFVRFRDPSTGAMVERSWTISYDPRAPRFDRASPSLQLAGIAALITEKLNETPMASQFKLGDFAAVVNSIKSHYSREPRVQELVTMFGRMRRLSGE
jgi:Ca-activated chloride channel family protein